MIRFFLLMVSCAALTTSLTARAEQIKPTPVDGKINWIYQYTEGKQLARRLQRPMFVVFRCER